MLQEENGTLEKQKHIVKKSELATETALDQLETINMELIRKVEELELELEDKERQIE